MISEQSKREQDLFVQVDEANRVLGPIPREQCCNYQVFHRTISVLSFNNKGELAIQLRASNLPLFADFYTLSATGHVDWLAADAEEDFPGGPENTEVAAQREYSEELGLVAPPLSFVLTLPIREVRHTVMVAVFKTYNDRPFIPNPKEVQKVEYFRPEQLRELDKITPPSRKVLQAVGLL